MAIQLLPVQELLDPTAYLPRELSQQVWRTLADPEVPAFARAVLNSLAHTFDPHAGASSPVPLAEIQRYAKNVLECELSERLIKRGIQVLVDDWGIAIGASRKVGAHGYYFVTTDKEAENAARPLLSEAISLLKRCKTLSPKNAYIQHLNGQMEVRNG